MYKSYGLLDVFVNLTLPVRQSSSLLQESKIKPESKNIAIKSVLNFFIPINLKVNFTFLASNNVVLKFVDINNISVFEFHQLIVQIYSVTYNRSYYIHSFKHYFVSIGSKRFKTTIIRPENQGLSYFLASFKIGPLV